jgi:hypothetical protein
MAVTYREKNHTAYMPDGGGRFLFQCQIIRRPTYMRFVRYPNNNSKTDMMFLIFISEPLSSDAPSSLPMAKYYL